MNQNSFLPQSSAALILPPISQTSPSLTSRAANNSRSSDNGCPKFANIRQNRYLGQTFCLANFLLQHLTISFTKKFDFLIRYSFECTFVFMSNQIFLLSDQNGALVGHMSFQGKKIICSPANQFFFPLETQKFWISVYIKMSLADTFTYCHKPSSWLTVLYTTEK